LLAVVSGIVIALALLAPATHFDRVTPWFGFLLMSVALFIGLTTFVRSIVINYEVNSVLPDRSRAIWARSSAAERLQRPSSARSSR
jgi:hypothetical protein